MLWWILANTYLTLLIWKQRTVRKCSALLNASQQRVQYSGWNVLAQGVLGEHETCSNKYYTTCDMASACCGSIRRFHWRSSLPSRLVLALTRRSLVLSTPYSWNHFLTLSRTASCGCGRTT